MGKRQYDMTVRRAKAAETQERIRNAAVALYRDAALENFTLDDVAERAGTTVQTVLRTFGSKEQLIIAALIDVAADGQPIRSTPPGDIAAAVHAIHDVYEAIGDFLIGQLADERRRPALRASLEAGRDNHRAWVRQIFACELRSRRGNARAQLFSILVVALDVYAWKLLRRDLALSRVAAEAAVRAIITGVIDAENDHGTHPLAELVGRR